MIEPSKTALEVFTAARSLLCDKNKWCCFARAKNVGGVVVHPGDSSAVAWDLESAVGICDNSAGVTPIPFLYILDDAVKLVYPIPITHHQLGTGEPEAAMWEYVVFESATYINDWCGHDAVLHVLDTAIELVRSHVSSPSIP